MSMKTIRGLEDVNGTPITSMGADWESKWYEMGGNLHLCAHLFWDDPTITGNLYLDYSGDPAGDATVLSYAVKELVNLDGTFGEQIWLDGPVAIASFRFRYERTAGTAALDAFIVKKG